MSKPLGIPALVVLLAACGGPADGTELPVADSAPDQCIADIRMAVSMADSPSNLDAALTSCQTVAQWAYALQSEYPAALEITTGFVPDPVTLVVACQPNKQDLPVCVDGIKLGFVESA